MMSILAKHVLGGIVILVLVIGSMPGRAQADGGELTLTVLGRNVTRGQSGEHVTVNARGGDTLDLIVRAHSLSSASLSNVIVTDYLPLGLAYIPGSTTLNRFVIADGITSTGLNIGSLAPGQEAVVKLSVRFVSGLVPSVGYVTVSNAVQARADGIGTVSARMPLTLGVLSLVSAGGVRTGPLDAPLLALAAAMLTTGIYAGYARTGAFRRRMATREIRALIDRPLNFDR